MISPTLELHEPPLNSCWNRLRIVYKTPEALGKRTSQHTQKRHLSFQNTPLHISPYPGHTKHPNKNTSDLVQPSYHQGRPVTLLEIGVVDHVTALVSPPVGKSQTMCVCVCVLESLPGKRGLFFAIYQECI